MRRWRRGLGVVLVLGVLKVLQVPACATDSVDDAEARLRYVARRVDASDFGVAPGHPFDGEWRLGTLSMAALAATNLALKTPGSLPVHREQVQRWARRLLSDEVRGYDTRQWGSDPLATLETSQGHAGYLGHVALALGAACLLGGPVEADTHAAIVQALARRLDEAPTGLIETYPGETYVPDNVVAMAAVSVFDDCEGQGRYAALKARWLARLTARHLDADTGLLVFAPGQPARGSGAAWNTAFLPFIDQAFAQQQEEALWRAFESRLAFGARGIRERQGWDTGGGDVDSGPLVWGLSPSATGFALFGAARRGDTGRVHGLLVTAETVGVTVGFSERRYLFAPLVGDAIVLAARTATPWPTAPLPVSAQTQPAPTAR